ncbi:MAG TPA: NAD(P)-binding domain-containing protein, partial [Aggregatilineales bacterium]|nr:NAD(P)-binding domain-containing protein [Aggregatilineales bacterium]
MSERLGFVGLGIMGRGMVRNLLKAGYGVRVWNRTASRSDALVADGATAAASPRDVAEHADIVFICVSDTPDVEAVIFGADGLAAGMRQGGLIIDMSTISPQATQQFARKLAEGGIAML